MLRKSLVPSPLIPEKEQLPLVIEPPLHPKGRFFAIIWSFCRFGMVAAWMRLRRRATGKEVGALTRQLLQELGFLWVKVGQILSLRRDFFGEPFCREVSKLQNQAPGFPGEMSIETIEGELGKPVEELYKTFDRVPFAAASIGQVHRATLKNGTSVVVKVRRPYAEEIFAVDMRFVHFCVKVLNFLGIMTFLRWEEFLWELKEIMSEEVDYRYELNNIKRIRKTLKKHKVYVPVAFKHLCSRRVLTMEFIPGVLMSDYINIRNSDPARALRWESANGLNRKKVGERLNLSFLRQLLEDRLFHGDLHPGNIMLLKDSRVALLDCGSIVTPKQDLWHAYMMMLKSLAMRDYKQSADHMFSLAPSLPVFDLGRARADVDRMFRTFERKSENKQLDYHEKSLSSGLTEVLELMSRERIMVSWAFLRIDRSWATLDATLYYLVPEINYPKLFRKYFRKRERRLMSKIFAMDRLRATLVSIPDEVQSLRSMIEPRLREAALWFGVRTSRVAQVIKEVLRFFTLISGGGVAFLIYTYLHQFHDVRTVTIIHDLALEMPNLARHYWFLAIVLGLLVTWTLVRMRRILSQSREIRLPNRLQTYD